MLLSAHIRKSSHDESEYPELKINGESLGELISAAVHDPDIATLVPAHSWLCEDDELKLAWDRLLTFGEGQIAVVPLLICPDDMDFGCTVIVAEQRCVPGEFIWSRFGFARDRLLNDIEWFAEPGPFRFIREDFISQVFTFMDLCKWSLE